MKIPGPADTFTPPHTCRCSLVLSHQQRCGSACHPEGTLFFQHIKQLNSEVELWFTSFSSSPFWQSKMPAKISAVEVNKIQDGLVLPLGSQWHTSPSVLLFTVVLQNSCGAWSHALPSVPCGTEGSAGREAVTLEGVEIKATSTPLPVPTAVTVSTRHWWTWLGI